jgi:putative acetyltransferase
MPGSITQEPPDTPEARALIEALEAYLAPLYPADSQHGLSVDRLMAEGVAFYVVRCEGEAAGCGGLKFYGQAYAEIKRMFVRPDFRGQGLAKQILTHLEAQACQRGVLVLRLETGTRQPEALGLYERLGYQRCGPFGEYAEDPLSIFYEKHLTHQRSGDSPHGRKD